MWLHEQKFRRPPGTPTEQTVPFPGDLRRCSNAKT